MTLPSQQAGWGADASDAAPPRSFSVHGIPLDIACGFSPLTPQIDWTLGSFARSNEPWPAAFVPITGEIRPYDLDAMTRHLSPTARRWNDGIASHDGESLEIYEQDERFWLVDERWGMLEVNLLRNQWRSWVLPEPKIDPVRCAELAVLWPLAQLLRGRGLHVIPAASAVRDGRAVLILGASSLDPELAALLDAGYRLIGQRWTAIREEEGRLALLQMPGRVERTCGPRLAGAAGRNDFFGGDANWVDLTAQPGRRQTHAFCDAVMAIAPGRRAHAELHQLGSSQALSLLRHAWPIVELHPSGRSPQLPGKLARVCCCAEVQLSRDPREILALVSQLNAVTGPAAVEISSEAESLDGQSETMEPAGFAAAA